MTPHDWQPLPGSTDPIRSVVVGGWEYRGPVIGMEWRQAVASFWPDDGWVLDEVGSYAQDGDLPFRPTHFFTPPVPPKP